MRGDWIKIPVPGESKVNHSTRVRKWCKANNIDARIIMSEDDVWNKQSYDVWEIADPKHRTLFALRWL